MNGELVRTRLVVNMLDQRDRKLTPEFMTYTIAKMGLVGDDAERGARLGTCDPCQWIGPGPTLQGAGKPRAF